MTCAGQDFQHLVPADAGKLVVGNTLALKVTAPEGKTVKSVKSNGKDAMGGKEMFGFWCFSIVEGANTITIELA